MHKKDSLISYEIFEPDKGLFAFTTTKQTFINPAPRFTGEEPVIYHNNRIKLAAMLNINEKQLIFPRQTHTNCVTTISAFPHRKLEKTDALVTNKTGICLCIQTADCVPILLFDPRKKVIAAVHSGWRGTVKQIVAVAVNKMADTYNCRPYDILAAIGPSIGPEVYEIGDDVISVIEKRAPILKKALINEINAKTHFNLWEANRIILLDCGLLKEHIEISEECSFSENEKYFSARREGAATGRMVSGVILIE